MGNTELTSIEIKLEIADKVLQQIDRIVKEKNLTREKVISDVINDHFSKSDDWLDDIIQ